MKKIVLVILLLTSRSLFAQVNLNLGLRAYYPFSGNANDVSGNNNNPAFNNATLTADRFGNTNSAYHFNGTSSYMRIPNSASLNMGTQMSIAAWVKPTGFYTGPCANNMLMAKGDGDYLAGSYSLRFADEINGCNTPTNTSNEHFYGPAPVASTPVVQLNQWYSVVCTNDGVTAKIYVNCVLKASGSIGSPSFTTTFDLYFGRMNDAQYPYWLNGDLDEVRIYNRALNQAEVNVLGGCPSATPCSTWLSVLSNPSYVTVGDLDVSGNQVTVECNLNRIPPLNSGIGYGHVVSKHTDASNVNYALTLNGCEITTTGSGYKSTYAGCDPDLNKTYHIAMVYDGSNLKFYRNGFLMSQTPCTGNMVTNNLLTTIGEIAGNGYPLTNQVLGYVNEVRIWNVARTQTQIQTYMNSSLPNPSTQTGLLGYYVFDDLANKQGNAAFAGTLHGAAAINTNNPNCTFVADTCPSTPCTSWLSTPSQPSYVDIGDLDISGTQLTIEATGNRTSFLSNGIFTDGDLVSKHTNTNNANYTLRPDYAFVSTSNGFYSTPRACEIDLNKTYHYAMVYDGATLKFYRDGFLMGQTAATGNLTLNDLNTTIAWIPSHNLTENFVGYINEVRIWNVARTQTQLRTYMNSPLPNPTTQPGLLAYYTFDNLQNKQGNAAWNGTLGGSATINATNPNCTFTADSCKVSSAIGGIINDYTPVLGLDPCKNLLTVQDGTKFNTGDTVLLIQMKGAVIDSSNTNTFGTITNYDNSGNYEFNYVKSKTGNVIELKNKLTRQYDIPTGKVQLIRVPYYNSVTITSPLTCLAWDGSKGGVLVLNAKDTVTLQSDIDVGGKGFRGGIDPVGVNTSYNCYENQLYYPDTRPDLASGKGEGIADISSARSFGKGALANGGGSGNAHNSGGAGGGNIGAGGMGGYQYEGAPCNVPVPFDNRGVSGKTLPLSNASNKIFLGGGGGAGQTNDPAGGFQAIGGTGAGIAIILADKIISNSKKITANGNTSVSCGLTTSACHEGMGGGGAAGTILMQVNTYVDNTTVEAKGGKGGDMSAVGFGRLGPGGGGGGGTLWLKNPGLPANVVINNTGGANGVCLGYANDPWGATAGSVGSNLFNLVVPVDNIPFTKNIDSTRIKDSATTCFTFDFKGLGYTNTNPISTWQWTFGDGGTANTQNPSHNYGSVGTFPVKLVIIDINGCKDSITKNVSTTLFIADAGSDTTVCSAPSVSVTLHASPGTAYSWTPAALLNNPSAQNPVATVSGTTRFYVTITSPANPNCKAIDSVLITMSNAIVPAITISTPTTTICTGTSATFFAIITNGGSSPTYQWQKNGAAVGTNSNTYTEPNLNDGDLIKCILTSSLSCALPTTAQSNSITMTVSAPPANIRYPLVTGLTSQSIQLQARNLGGNSYNWQPVVGLNNHLIINPIFNYNQSQEYKIYIGTPAGCLVVDTQLVTMKGTKGIYVPKGFSPNGDGVNDRLYPILVGIKELYFFRIYNRWGNLLFETNSGNPASGWNGLFKGHPQPVESYTWAAEALDIDGFIIKKTGSTLLVR